MLRYNDDFLPPPDEISEDARTPVLLGIDVKFFPKPLFSASAKIVIEGEPWSLLVAEEVGGTMPEALFIDLSRTSLRYVEDPGGSGEWLFQQKSSKVPAGFVPPWNLEHPIGPIWAYAVEQAESLLAYVRDLRTEVEALLFPPTTKNHGNEETE